MQNTISRRTYWRSVRHGILQHYFIPVLRIRITSMQIRILLVILIWIRIRILLVTLMRMRIRIRILPFTLMRILIRILASKYRLKTLKKCSDRLIFYSFLACHLQIDADPDPNPDYHFDADPNSDPDPQHCLIPWVVSKTDVRMHSTNNSLYRQQPENTCHVLPTLPNSNSNRRKNLATNWTICCQVPTTVSRAQQPNR